MHTFTITPRTKRKPALTFKGPSDWDELDSTFFLSVMRARLKVEDHFQQAMALITVLFRVPEWYIKQLTHAQAIQLASCMNFVFDPEVKIEKWMIRKIFPNARFTLYGPGDTLENITFGELMYADMHFRRYQDTKNEDNLNKLIAVLYCRRSSDEEFKAHGDLRTAFNKVHLDADAEYCASAKEEVKQGILVNYIGCRSIMTGLFKNVFPLINNDADPEQTDAPQKQASWLDVAIQLARKEHALGTIAEVEKHNAYLVLKVLDKVIQENEELEYEASKLRN